MTPIAALNTTADTTVYVTATGSKYHFSRSCRGLNRARSISETSLSNAQSRGLEPCSICAGGYSSGGSSGGSSSGYSDSSSYTPDPVVVAPTPTPVVSNAKISTKKMTLKAGDKSKDLSVTGNNGSVKWVLKKGKGIVSLKKNGATVTVKGKKPGNAVIYAKVDGKTLKCKVTVLSTKKWAYNTLKKYLKDNNYILLPLFYVVFH